MNVTKPRATVSAHSRPQAVVDPRAGRDVLRIRDDDRFGGNPEKPIVTDKMTVGELIALSFGCEDADFLARAHLFDLADDLNDFSKMLYAHQGPVDTDALAYRVHRMSVRARAALELASRLRLANAGADDDVANDIGHAAE